MSCSENKLKETPIYFCGSIRGGTQDAGIYQQIIKYLTAHFGRVLTEHVGDPTRTMQMNLTDNEIWIQDMSWLREAKVVVAEVTVKSLGVGYELGIAEALKLPTLCLYRLEEGDGKVEGARKLSAMITGNPHLTTIYYANMKEALEAVDLFMEKQGLVKHQYQ